MYGTRKARKRFTATLVLGLFSVVMLGQAVPVPAAAPSVPSPSNPQPMSTSPYGGAIDPAPLILFWDGLWYVRGLALYDAGTGAVAASEGSTLMAFQAQTGDPKETWWTFLEGNFMYVLSPALLQAQVTYTPGDTFLTQPGQGPHPPKEPNPVAINGLLVQLYDYSRAAALPPIRHVSFLTGPGWPHAAGLGDGAWHQTAEALLKKMNLEMKPLGPNTTGYVVWQNPPGGTLLASDVWEYVFVTLDGATDAPPPRTFKACVAGGDSFFDAVEITAPGGACGETCDKNDTVTARCSSESGPVVRSPEVVWKLPKLGREVTVNVSAPPDPADPRLNRNLRISAWLCQQEAKGPGLPCVVTLPQPSHCALGDNPSLQFSMPAGSTGYLVAEEAHGARVRIELDVRW